MRRVLLFAFHRRPLLLKTFRLAAAHAPFLLSSGLHVFILLLFICDFSGNSAASSEKIISVPVMNVDLSNVPVSSLTNLPPALGKLKKPQKNSKKSVKTSSYTRASKASGNKMQQQKTTEKSDTALVSKKLDSLLNSVLAPQKKEERPAAKKSKDTDFQTLLASVDGLRQAPAADAPDYLEDEAENTGIKGGQGGSFARELSVSEKDMLGLKLRACWNIDAGVRGAQNMIVEIRASLSPEGQVTDVKILNAKRYKNDTAFRSVAESARRAVYICADKKEESPFLFFPQRYPDAYDDWKTLLLRFNPLDGEVL